MAVPSATQRLAALDAANGPEREAVILAALEDDAPTVRERAVRLAARYVEPQVLGAMVADGVNAARRNGALAALERQGPYAVPHLVELLQSPDSDVVMFALRPFWRWQTQGTYTLGFNAIMHWNDLDAGRSAQRPQTSQQ